jgi:serine/threonine-protein kinase
MKDRPSRAYEFGDFRVDAGERQLLLRGVPVALAPKAFDTLLYLVQHSGRLLGKDELMAAVWPDTVVEQNNLNQSISALRRALGEGREEHDYIVTVPGHGYRFVVDVREITKPAADTGAPEKTIAVLPFVNMSSDPENQYFCDGLAEELLNALAKIEGLNVAARTSAFSFKGKSTPIGEVARALGVDTILEGSVRWSGVRVRITAQLISAENGYHMWSERYEREVEMSGIFDVQDEITRAVVNALEVRLLGRQVPVLKRYTYNPEAHELYLRGRYFWFKFPSKEYEKSRDYYERAIQVDPGYALAHAGLAEFYGFGVANGFLPPSNEIWSKAAAAAERALALDAALPDAYNVMAGVKQFSGDRAGAEGDLKRVIEANPNYSEGRHHYAYLLLENGRLEEACAQMKVALALEPLSVPYNRMLAMLHYRMRDHDRAVRQYRKALELDPNDAFTRELLGDVYEQQGMEREAVVEWVRALTLIGQGKSAAKLQRTFAASGFAAAVRIVWRQKLEQLEERNKRGEYVTAMNFALAYTRLRDKDEAFAWLTRAAGERNAPIYAINSDPVYDPLRADPRFAAILDRIKFQ